MMLPEKTIILPTIAYGYHTLYFVTGLLLVTSLLHLHIRSTLPTYLGIYKKLKDGKKPVPGRGVRGGEVGGREEG
jgi:hypothetical protein